MNNPVKPQFPNTPIAFSALSSKDIEEHRLACLAVPDPELYAGDTMYGLLPLTDLETKFRRTFKIGTKAPNKGYGCGEECFLWRKEKTMIRWIIYYIIASLIIIALFVGACLLYANTI